jgi:hypothetical protein
MDNDRFKKQLKAIYRDVNASEGFSARVMLKISTDADHALPSNIASVLRRDLRPYIAAAACFILVLGVYLTGILSPAAPLIVERAALDQPFVDNAPEDIQIAEGDKYVNGETPLPDEKPDAEVTLAQNGQEAEKPAEPVAAEAPVIEPFESAQVVAVPSERDNQAAAIPSPQIRPADTNGYTLAARPAPSLEITPIAEQAPSFALKNVEIPDSSVYVRRTRVINSVTVNLSVRSIDKTLPRLEEWERIQGMFPDIVITENRSNGTKVMIRSYIMTPSYKSVFINFLGSLGTNIGINRDRLDVTEQYLRMLDRHRELIDNVSATGRGAHEVNEIVADLIFFDKRTQEGVHNVVVWLEDAVDL